MFFKTDLKANRRFFEFSGMLLFLAMVTLWVIPLIVHAEESTDKESASAAQEASQVADSAASETPPTRPKEPLNIKNPGCGGPGRIEYGKPLDESPENDSDSSGQWEFTMGSMF